MTRRLALAAALSIALTSSAGAQAGDAAPRVGPPRGAVMVVGGGTQGPELYAKFIELAGGPDALIIDVPTAGGDSVYPADWRGTRGLKAAGARNIVCVAHARSPKRRQRQLAASHMQHSCTGLRQKRTYRLIHVITQRQLEGNHAKAVGPGGEIRVGQHGA